MSRSVTVSPCLGHRGGLEHEMKPLRQMIILKTMMKTRSRYLHIYSICMLILFDSSSVSVAISQTDVWGELSKKVILPCPFKPGKDEVIHWNDLNPGTKPVHSYYYRMDKLDNQDPAYSGRTSLFPSELSQGNASLLITDVQKSDEKNYSCYVGTSSSSVEHEIRLHITAFENPTIKYTSKNDRRQLNCSVKNSTPEDAISVVWLQNNMSVAAGIDFHIENSTDILQCVIHHAYLDRTWTGYWEMTELSTEQHKVKLECKVCQSIQQNFSVQWTKRTNFSEIEVASMDSVKKTLQPADGYKQRLEQASDDEYAFYIKDLGTEDTGEYLCTTVQINGMQIIVTSLTVKGVEGNKALIIGLIIGGICFVLGIAGLRYWYKSRGRNQDDVVRGSYEERTANFP
uniref:Ig-like domain-containing protein n=1 Tax=Leptobrachium leishanense TaxID=445787 RepID=A0A8C5LMX7_9ANUR